MAIAKRLLSAAAAALGVGLAVVGFWFAAHLGTSGSARFTMTPTDTPVLLDSGVLDRVSVPTTIVVTPATGHSVWLGVAAPSDLAAVLGSGRTTRVTGVQVREWQLAHELTGSGKAPDLPKAEIWRIQQSTTTPLTIRVDPKKAPETYAIVAAPGAVSSVSVTWQRSGWFFQSLIVGVVGLLLALGGGFALLRSLRPVSRGRVDS